MVDRLLTLNIPGSNQLCDVLAARTPSTVDNGAQG